MSLELNSCVLIDYRLWAAKSEGRQWVEHCIEQCIEHPPEPRSGLCPELLADFRIPNLLGARRGAEGSFLCSPSSRFSGRGGGVGSPPGRGGELGCRRCVGAKKIVRLHRFFLHQISLESKLNGRQKVKGGNGSISASISTSLIASLITLNLGVGCAPSCWPIFGFRNLLGARRGTEGSFLCSPSSRFSGTGGGLGSLPRASRASWGGRQRRCALPKPAP